MSTLRAPEMGKSEAFDSQVNSSQVILNVQNSKKSSKLPISANLSIDVFSIFTSFQSFTPLMLQIRMKIGMGRRSLYMCNYSIALFLRSFIFKSTQHYHHLE